MSKTSDFLAHLDKVPQTPAQLQEASGEDRKTVGNRLNILKGQGMVRRVADGWVTTVKATAAANASTTTAPLPVDAKTGIEVKRGAKKATKKRTANRRSPKVAAAPSNGAILSFFIDDDFDLQICRKDGTGEAAVIAREEALRLRDFLNQVGDLMRLA